MFTYSYLGKLQKTNKKNEEKEENKSKIYYQLKI